MRRHIQGIDHVMIVVRDLDAALDSFKRMGFTATPRGDHTLGSRNHCLMFGHDYIELLTSPADNTHPSLRYYTEFAQVGDGLAAIALKTDDARGAYSEVLWAGFEPQDPVDFARPVRLPQGASDARFRITQLGEDKTPGAKTFLCQHFTPELVWRPEYCKHKNGASGLAAVMVLADDVAAAARPYERLLDVQAREIEEGLLVETGDTPIAFATERKLGKRLPDVWISARPAPMLAALFIRVADRDRAEATLTAGGFTPRRMPDGSVAIGADAAHGVALVFG